MNPSDEGRGHILTSTRRQRRRFLRVAASSNNIFDKAYETAADFATAGANVFAGVRYAPK
jgi:outer membrane cobalamin receptor